MLAVARKRRRWRYFASVPERTVRAGAAGLGCTLHDSFELTLPRFVRRSRLYEVTAKNLLRVMVELVGGVEALTGILMCGWSTGFFFAVVSRAYTSRARASDS